MNFKTQLILAAFFLAGCPEAPLDTTDKTDIPTDVDVGDADTDADSDADSDSDTDTDTATTPPGSGG